MKSYRNVDAVTSNKNNFRDNIGKIKWKGKEQRKKKKKKKKRNTLEKHSLGFKSLILLSFQEMKEKKCG